MTAVVVLAFGVAMGYLEAAVVVYLGSALEMLPAAVPAHDPETFGTFEAIEIARELATLVMIAAVGWLAGRTRLERLAWAAVVFGAWDIVYYLGLRLTIGWPSSFNTWDLLFLVPMSWVAPVWAPVLASVALVLFGLAAARRLRLGRPIVVGPWHIAGALGGAGLRRSRRRWPADSGVFAAPDRGSNIGPGASRPSAHRTDPPHSPTQEVCRNG
jgi:hypothetical protein